VLQVSWVAGPLGVTKMATLIFPVPSEVRSNVKVGILAHAAPSISRWLTESGNRGPEPEGSVHMQVWEWTADGVLCAHGD
jgi:hypothetical protein